MLAGGDDVLDCCVKSSAARKCCKERGMCVTGPAEVLTIVADKFCLSSFSLCSIAQAAVVRRGRIFFRKRHIAAVTSLMSYNGRESVADKDELLAFGVTASSPSYTFIMS